MANDVEKWERYYSNPDAAPPWESQHPHGGLVRWLEGDCPIVKGGNVLELGAGSSASASLLCDSGYHTTCLDISPLAKQRYFNQYPDKAGRVNYLTGDCLDLEGKGEVERMFESVVPPLWSSDMASGEKKNLNITDGYFDFILDLQCFHVTRDIDEYRHVENVFKWCRPGGFVMVVTGATSDHSDLSLEQLSYLLEIRNSDGKTVKPYEPGASILTATTQSIQLPPRKPVPGPPKLYKAELVEPFLEHGFSLVECVLTNFNSTPAYLAMSTAESSKAMETELAAAESPSMCLRPKKGLMPLAWQAVFRKPTYDELVDELYKSW